MNLMIPVMIRALFGLQSGGRTESILMSMLKLIGIMLEGAIRLIYSRNNYDGTQPKGR